MVDYSWVPWFRELARNIAEGGPERFVEKAKAVDWLREDPPLLRHGDDVDPLSFFCTLASRRNPAGFMQRLHSAGAVFGIKADALGQPPIIPISNPINIGFHGGDDGAVWKLFLQAAEGARAIDGDLFDNVLGIRGVAMTKLTQVLFLVNPDHFLPADDTVPGPALLKFKNLRPPTTYEEYKDQSAATARLFPGCKPYEINAFLWAHGEPPLVTAESKYFQVSTNVYNKDEDHWPEFERWNGVWTGGPGGKQRYPLTEVKPGDVVLVRRGTKQGHGIGVVEANGYAEGWEPWEEGGDKQISVHWINKMNDDTLAMNDPRPNGFGRAGKESDIYQAFAQASAYAGTLSMLDKLAAEGAGAATAEAGTEAPLKVPSKAPLNQILFGPPGTSKTYKAVSEALEIAGGHVPGEDREAAKVRFEALREQGRVEFVTFHQSYAYEDFIEGIRPKVNEQELRYELLPGIFKKIAERARKDLERNYVLIIDEINRGNVAKIFGELITLIEPSKREGRADAETATLPYSQKPFSVPSNLYLIGTMNTADRGIAPLDTALRRRFEFVERMPDGTLVKWVIDGVKGEALLRAMNRRIVELLDRDHQIGHTYLMEVKTLQGLADAFRNQIVPLLQEYFYDDWEKIQRVLNGNGFIASREGMVEPKNKVWEVLPADDGRWEQAERYQTIYNGGRGGADGE